MAMLPTILVLSTQAINAATITVRGTDAGARNVAQLERCPDDGSPFEMSAETFLAVTSNVSQRVGFCGIYYVKFSGEIDARSIAQLKRVISVINSRLGTLLVAVEMDSEGGNVWEALSFARFIREHNLAYVIMQVDDGSKCYSSCVFMLAGGIQRMVLGEIGIHRPYFTDLRMHQAGYDGLFVQLRDFLASVNISDRLASDMWIVPSDKLQVLTDDEVKHYGLSENDTVFTELRDARQREACGPSAPQDFNDYLTNVLYACEDARNRMDYACFSEKLRSHPYCRCFVQANPGSGYVCD
jgi:hypothetical protein